MMVSIFSTLEKKPAMSYQHKTIDEDDVRLDAGVHASCPELICQVANLPEEGSDLEGELPFHDLDLESDDRFDLSGTFRYRLHLAPVKQEVLVTGVAWATVRAICDRCAEYGECQIRTAPILHRYENPFGEPIDLTEAIREDILLAFPQSFHCREDCRGLCPVCGQNLNLGLCNCQSEEQETHATGENPWQALNNLHLQN